MSHCFFCDIADYAPPPLLSVKMAYRSPKTDLTGGHRRKNLPLKPIALQGASDEIVSPIALLCRQNHRNRQDHQWSRGLLPCLFFWGRCLVSLWEGGNRQNNQKRSKRTANTLERYTPLDHTPPPFRHLEFLQYWG